MSIKKFGQYLIEIESPKIGLEIVLDGIDGFDTQTLWNLKKDDKIHFIINPSPVKKLLSHVFLETKVLGDTNTNDWANVKIINISTLDNVFKSKCLENKNDFEELIKDYKKMWNKTKEMKGKIKNYRYHPFHNHFLTFKELNQTILTNEFETQRKGRGLSKIYSRRLDDKSIRVLSINNNYPESCLIYDINDVEYYKSEIQKMKNRNQFIDENEFWKRIIFN